MYLFGTSTYIYFLVTANAVALFLLGWWLVWWRAVEKSPRLGQTLLIFGGAICPLYAIFTYSGVWWLNFLLLLVDRATSYYLRQREEQVSPGAVFGSGRLHSPQMRQYLLWSEVRLLLTQIGVYFVMRLIWVQP